MLVMVSPCGRKPRSWIWTVSYTHLEDIKAEFHHGVLKLFVPKKEAKAVEQKSTIAIEG